MKRLTVRELVLCSLFTALVAVGAFLRIPVPLIPFTLQLFFTTMAGFVLGPRLGALSVGLYVALGLLGVPIFTEGGGFGYVLKPSFGYLIGFIVTAYVVGKMSEKNPTSLKHLIIAALSGMMVTYAFGVVYCYFVTNVVLGIHMTAWIVFLHGFLLVVPSDIMLSILAAIVAKRLQRAMLWMK